MASPAAGKNNVMVVSALRLRADCGRLLRQIEDECQSLIIEKRGRPKAVLLSIREYVKLAAPEPDVLRAIGEESLRKGTNTITPRQIERIIRIARKNKRS